ncbi:MAG: hypothetical protein JJE25_01775 [Bacteroidia bacterium]|nr:hypothetical protein [Bacteroidia bacterium]
MSNPTINRIDTVIAAPDLLNITTGFSQVNTALDPYAETLTQTERDSLFSVKEENKVFADDALEQGQLLLAQFPPVMQTVVSNMKNDTTLNEQLETIENTQVNPLMQRISDTRRLASHERYSAAIAIYKFIEAGASLAMPGFEAAYDILKVRFARQGSQQPNP